MSSTHLAHAQGGAMRPPPGGTLSEFFRYHGAWAPGIRLFRRIGFRGKALVISAVFALPIAVLAWSYFADKQTAIAFSSKERVGVAYARELLPLLRALQQRPAQDAAVQARLAALQRLEERHAQALGTDKAFAALRQAVGRADAAALPALLDLLAASADGSNLTLDPDIDTYYLMDAAMGRMPQMLDALARARDHAHAAIQRGAAHGNEDRRLVEQAAVLAGHVSATRSGLAKAVAYNPEVGAALRDIGALDRIAAFLTLLDASALNPAGARGDPAALDAAAGRAAGELEALAGQATEELDRLIALRVSSMERGRNATAATLLLSLLVAMYLFSSFGKVLDGGLEEVAYHINAMRDGDLTTRPRAWGADEAAGLMNTLADMQDALRGMVKRVREVSESVESASSEIAQAAQDLSARTEESAANLEQSAAAMEQVASTVRQTADVAGNAAQLAATNSREAERSGQVIASVVSTMDAIEGASTRIGDIIGTIDGIAFQTNLLALNAAVEAARAGAAGRGFAVVATEVRALSQRTTVAARDIKHLITDSAGHVRNGSGVVRDAGGAIGQVLASALRVNTMLHEIAGSVDEQARGVAQTSQAVQALDDATQRNAALVEQTAAAAGSLREQARVLTAEVARFRLPGT